MKKGKLTKSLTEFGGMYLKNRMGQAGLILLLIFIVIAALAPHLTPYDPIYTMQLANFRAKPKWLDPTLPPNFYPVSNPEFDSSSALNDWKITADTAFWGWTGLNGYQGIPLVEEGSGNGAVEITGVINEDEVISMEKAFQYTYKPPRRFNIHLAYMTEVTGEAVWSIQVLIKQTNGALLELWNSGPQRQSQSWIAPKPAIDTNDAILRTRLFGNILADASRIFPIQGNYSLIIRIQIQSQGGSVKIYLDDVSARVWGESFGLLGTDNYGRDIFTQLMHGSRISILRGIFSAIIAVFLGVLVGLTSGYIGGWVDEVLMRINDILLTIPGLPFLIVLTAVLGPTIWSVIILIGFLGWMGIARLIRSQVLTLKTKAFVEASKASGGDTWHIISRHLIPNVMTMAYTQLALTVPGAIVTEAALSFLGLGDPFLQTWGKMLHDVQYYGAVSEWWWAVPPGVCIALLSMSFVFIGYALDDIFNPMLRGR
jgi:ABC-type dipeptide/oligopeptide/nickel transport system permease subunit